LAWGLGIFLFLSVLRFWGFGFFGSGFGSSVLAGFFFFLKRPVSQFQKSFHSSFFSSQSKKGNSK
jgi:hypothetical protein